MIKNIKCYVVILLGVILLSVGISMFCVPNKIVSGGVAGIATILYYLFNIPAGFTYYALNILLLLIGFKFLSKRFLLRTLICSGLVSLFVYLFSKLPPVTDDVVLASLFGGVIYGIGIVLTFIEDASTGGTDIIGRLIQNRFPQIPIGKTLLLVDVLIIALSLICFKNINLALYGILSLFISTTAIDLFIHRLNVSKVAFVITDRGEEILKLLLSSFPRGITVLNAKGAYTNEDKNILVCALKENQTVDFREKVMSVDKSAFIVFSRSEEIFGNGFYVYH